MSQDAAIGVVGLGLIGGGIALDLLRADRPVQGFDTDPDVRSRAAELGIPVAVDLDELVAGSALVVVAVPLRATGAVVTAIRDRSPAPVITDVASVKDPEVLGMDGSDDRYIGGHPMGGSERSGIDAARPGLFDGVAWFLTPTATTRVSDLVAVVRLARATAADPIVVTPTTHDRYVAMLSHVPHLVAFALNATATEALGAGLHGLGGGSFRDTTRVASSDPRFWADVLHANRSGAAETLRLVRAWLDTTAASLSDPDTLEARLDGARRRPVPAPDRTRVTVALPPPDQALGSTVEELCRFGALGYSVVDVADGTDGVTVELRWR